MPQSPLFDDFRGAEGKEWDSKFYQQNPHTGEQFQVQLLIFKKIFLLVKTIFRASLGS